MDNQNGDAAIYGTDLFGDPISPRALAGPLAERFLFPPFSVLDARSGEWQERKRAWIALGIKGEEGRLGGITSGDSPEITEPWLNFYRNKNKLENGKSPSRTFGQDLMRGEHTVGQGKRLTWVAGDRPLDELDEVSRKILAAQPQSGTSIFDPALAEIAYRWFCPPGGMIVDPFAGGSVRGIVAALSGYRYYGCDLRPEQIDANEAQRNEIIGPPLPGINQDCEWVCGDAMDVIEKAPSADFIFTCPPYGDLERYSDDPKDLSTMEYHTFLAAFKRVILRCYGKLNQNRFACVIVGDFRDAKTGHYRGFVADTVKAFQEIGMPLYNDAVLVTAVGSLPIRVSGQFDVSRKLGKTHQNVLVFCKGDPRKATQAIVGEK